MGRNKVVNKNKPISVSLPTHQIYYIETHSKFNLSKFLQLHLEDYLNLALEVEELKEESKKSEESEK